MLAVKLAGLTEMAVERALVSGSAQHLNQFSNLCLHRNYGMINNAFFHLHF